MKDRTLVLGLVVALLATVLLATAHRDTGYVRDEGIYFEAGRSYAAWLADFVRDPGQAATRTEIDRRFGPNHEHPALVKLIAGLSGRLLAGPLPLLREGAAMRLPTQAIAGLGVLLLFVAAARATAGQRGTGTAAALAAGWLLLQPHPFFHAGLLAFDMPIAVAILAVVLAYRRAGDSPRWSVALGVLLGVAIAVKHNALFVAPLLALHHALVLLHVRLRERRPLRLGQWIPFPFVSMAVLAPLVALLLWPWLWPDPAARVDEYFAFHREHAYYNVEYLGRNWNRPPLPVSYPFVMTLATVPATLLVLAFAGLASLLRADWSARGATEAPVGDFWRPRPAGSVRLDGVLFTIFAAFPILLIAAPSVPIFGGTKHWLTAYPFLALAAAVAWSRLWTRIGELPGRLRHAPAAALVCVLLPGVAATVDARPHGLSQYAPLAGGPRGAAEAGLLRGFWGHAVAGILEAESAGPRRRVYLHDVADLARKQYVREGRWPAGWTSARPEQADAGLVFHELHMAADEIRLWNALGDTRPAMIVDLDDVPLTSFYAR